MQGLGQGSVSAPSHTSEQIHPPIEVGGGELVPQIVQPSPHPHVVQPIITYPPGTKFPIGTVIPPLIPAYAGSGGSEVVNCYGDRCQIFPWNTGHIHVHPSVGAADEKKYETDGEDYDQTGF